MAVSNSDIKSRNIIFCNCGGDVIPGDTLTGIKNHLEKVQAAVTRMNDLCGIAAKKQEMLNDLLPYDSDHLVIGCNRRTMDILLGKSENHPDGSGRFIHINMLESSVSDAIDIIDDFCEGSETETAITDLAHDPVWHSWYPVVDYNRCTACGQCADFCLFGVYEKTGNGVKVINPEGCKENCPACGRICPSSAIIFPKYKSRGAISGADDIDEYAEQQRQVEDVEKILGSDIYSAMQKRKQKRQSIIRLEAMKKANEERENALKGN